MKFCQRAKDGGPASRVWGYFLLEWKRVCSLVLLRFENGSRDAYHSHAFHAVSWVLRGQLTEELLTPLYSLAPVVNVYRPSWRPIVTKRSTMHKVTSRGRTWVLSLRGPWAKYWVEYDPTNGYLEALTHGRESYFPA